MSIDPIARFEDSVQRLVEGGLARLFAGRLHAREVAVQITRCMEDQAVPDDTGRRHAPDIYKVRLNPADHQTILAEHPEITMTLGQEILRAAEMAGLMISSVPQVRLFADPMLRPHQVHISADHSHHEHDSTESMDSGAVWDIENEPHPDGRLLLEDDRVIRLDQPILNLGRQRDNQIVLDDPSISRHHAQIRLRFGHYTLFDLGSTGGTMINGQRVREAMLRSGDIIVIGRKTLIYVEEPSSTSSPGPEDTHPLTTNAV